MIAAIVVALTPIALLIALGHALRRRGFLPETFWPHAERLSYFILLPALFVHGLATADLDGLPIVALSTALIVPTLCVAAILFACSRFVAEDGPTFTSVFQGGVRFNNYVGVTAAIGLFGPAAIPLAAIANASIVPTVNVLCVLVFARHGAARASLAGVLRAIATNPLVVGCAVGVAFQASGVALPPGVEGFVKALGQASLPLGLLCVGAALDWSALGRGWRPVAFATAAKFGMMPLATAATCVAIGLDGRAAALALLFQSLPTASSAYVMSRQLGGDAGLMAGIIAFQTVLALVCVPAVQLIWTFATHT